jgi:hypothetical protein
MQSFKTERIVGLLLLAAMSFWLLHIGWLAGKNVGRFREAFSTLQRCESEKEALSTSLPTLFETATQQELKERKVSSVLVRGTVYTYTAETVSPVSEVSIHICWKDGYKEFSTDAKGNFLIELNNLDALLDYRQIKMLLLKDGYYEIKSTLNDFMVRIPTLEKKE